MKEKLSAQEAAKQAAEERRRQAARGAEPENPHFNAPASESQPPSWPAWENAVKVRISASQAGAYTSLYLFTRVLSATLTRSK